MRRKLPPDAFTYYVSLGPDRSYQAVANFYSVDKKTVVSRGKQEHWQDKLAEIERKAQEGLQQKLVSSLEEMNERHLKILRVVLGKALEALRSMPLRNAADAVRAIDVCVKHERLILGEPGDRTAVNVEQIIKREYETWLVREGEDEWTREAMGATQKPASAELPGGSPQAN